MLAPWMAFFCAGSPGWPTRSSNAGTPVVTTIGYHASSPAARAPSAPPRVRAHVGVHLPNHNGAKGKWPLPGEPRFGQLGPRSRSGGIVVRNDERPHVVRMRVYAVDAPLDGREIVFGDDAVARGLV